MLQNLIRIRNFLPSKILCWFGFEFILKLFYLTIVIFSPCLSFYWYSTKCVTIWWSVWQYARVFINPYMLLFLIDEFLFKMSLSLLGVWLMISCFHVCLLLKYTLRFQKQQDIEHEALEARKVGLWQLLYPISIDLAINFWA
jgi:hypothetical protein